MKALRTWTLGMALLAATAAGARPQPDSEALRVAGLLVAAERQAARPGHSRQHSRQLAATIAALEASGAAPAAGEPDPLPTWRALLPAGQAPAPLRGRTLGTAFRRGVIGPGQRLEFRQGFLAGQPAEVAVISPGKGTFELEVIEDGGRMICRSRGAVRRAACRWVPDFSGASIVRLSNGDRADTGFVMVLR